MLKDAARNALILDHGDPPHRAGAPSADEHVHRVRALQQDSPRQPSLAAGVIATYEIVILRMNRGGTFR